MKTTRRRLLGSCLSLLVICSGLSSVLLATPGVVSGAGTTSVSGQLRTADGSPVSTGDVVFGTGSPSPSARVHSDGTYSLSLARGTQRTVTYDEWKSSGSVSSSARDGYPDIYTLGSFTPSGAGASYNGTLPKAHVLSVTVVTADGKPVENAHVALTSLAGAGTGSQLHSTTNARGELTYPDGQTTGIEAAGWMKVRVSPPTGAALRGNGAIVYVGTNRSVTVTLGTQATITGTIARPSGTPATGLVVAYYADNGSFANVRRLDSSGDFSLTVPSGHRYEVAFYQSASANQRSSSRDGVVDYTPLRVVGLTGDRELGTITLPKGHVLDVTVTDSHGKPVSNAGVDVGITDRGDDPIVWSRFATNEAGAAYEQDPNESGVEAEGSVAVSVVPPRASTAYVPRYYDETLAVDGSTDTTVTLEPLPVAPNGHDYGAADVGHTVTQTFVVTNSGSRSLDLAGVDLTGPGASQFEVTRGGVPARLQPGDSRSITVAFTPTATGEHRAKLRLESTSSTAPERVVALSGAGQTAGQTTGSNANTAGSTNGGDSNTGGSANAGGAPSGGTAGSAPSTSTTQPTVPSTTDTQNGSQRTGTSGTTVGTSTVVTSSSSATTSPTAGRSPSTGAASETTTVDGTTADTGANASGTPENGSTDRVGSTATGTSAVDDTQHASARSPGFGVGSVLVALAVIGLLARRRP